MKTEKYTISELQDGEPWKERWEMLDKKSQKVLGILKDCTFRDAEEILQKTRDKMRSMRDSSKLNTPTFE